MIAESSTRTQSEINNRLKETSSPYYVNESLIRLPMNLTAHSQNTSYNNYVNSEQIDPCILHITNKFTRMKSNQDYYTFTKPQKATLKKPSNLNYILMEKVPKKSNQVNTENKKNNNTERCLSDINYISAEKVNFNSNKEKLNKPEAQIEYVMIDKNKTPAIQFSKQQIEKKRMEYVMLQRQANAR